MASDADAAAVRGIYERWNAADPWAVADEFALDCVLEDAPGMPDAGVVRGRDAVLERLDEVARAVGGPERGSVEILSVESGTDGVLLAMEWLLPSGPEGASDLGRVFHVVAIEGGKIARLRAFLDEGSARDAAGVPD